MANRLVTGFGSSPLTAVTRFSGYRQFSTTQAVKALGSNTNGSILDTLAAASAPSTGTTIATEPTSTKVKTFAKKNERTVMWKMYCHFNKHNTLLTLVRVYEDLDFMEKNAHLSYNEKVLYYLQLPHQTKLHVSAGQLGFRKAQRSEYEAGYQVSSKIFKLIEDRGIIAPNEKLELIFNNFGKGRDAFIEALQGKEGQYVRPLVTRMLDNTKLRFGGCRPKRQRRL